MAGVGLVPDAVEWGGVTTGLDRRWEEGVVEQGVSDVEG